MTVTTLDSNVAIRCPRCRARHVEITAKTEVSVVVAAENTDREYDLPETDDEEVSSEGSLMLSCWRCSWSVEVPITIDILLSELYTVDKVTLLIDNNDYAVPESEQVSGS